jgi:hypothetical protein
MKTIEKKIKKKEKNILSNLVNLGHLEGLGDQHHLSK